MLAIFLGLLGLFRLWILRHKDTLVTRLQGHRRLRIVETAALGASDRAMIVCVDGTDFLLVRFRGAPPVLQRLDQARCGDLRP